MTETKMTETTENLSTKPASVQSAETTAETKPASALECSYARLYPHGTEHTNAPAKQKDEWPSQPEIAVFNYDGDRSRLNRLLNLTKNTLEVASRFCTGYRLTYVFTVSDGYAPTVRNQQESAIIVRFAPCAITQSVAFYRGGSSAAYEQRDQAYREQLVRKLQQKGYRKEAIIEELGKPIDLDEATMQEMVKTAAKWSKEILGAYLRDCRRAIKAPQECSAPDLSDVDRWFDDFIKKSNIGAFNIDPVTALKAFAVAVD